MQYNQVESSQMVGGYNAGTDVNVNINVNIGYINFMGVQMQLVQDPMIVLAQSNVCYIKQSMDLLEILSGCEMPNRYNVFCKNSMTGQVTYLFRCKEESDMCTRLYCRGDSRPFKMRMKHVVNPQMDDNFMNTFATFDRPYKCTCCCLERPQLTGYYKTEQGPKFGLIQEQCTLYDPHFDIFGLNGEKKYQVHADCCQCGLLCRGGCGSCSQVLFPIFKSNATSFDQNSSAGMIKKVPNNLLVELLSNADNFEIDFPGDATPEEKLMLIGATLMIDYRYFEESPDKNKKNQLSKLNF